MTFAPSCYACNVLHSDRVKSPDVVLLTKGLASLMVVLTEVWIVNHVVSIRRVLEDVIYSTHHHVNATRPGGGKKS